LFAGFEDDLYRLVALYSSLGGQWENNLRLALNALHKDRLDLGSTATIFYTYGLAGVLLLFQFDAIASCSSSVVDLVLGGLFSAELLRIIIFRCGMGLLVVFMAITVAILWLSIMQSRAERRSGNRS
jgi:hypothetical protein